MNSKQFEILCESLFPIEVLNLFRDKAQFGFNNFIDKDIKKVGVAVNLTVNTINEANKNNCDLILTHHNVWDDLYEMVDDCKKLLNDYNIMHYYNHLPLDCMDFGPSRVLARQLGIKVTHDICKMENLAFGVVGEYNPPISLDELRSKLEAICGHTVRIWKNNDRLIKRLAVAAGSSGDPSSLHDAVLLNCDAYITGEKKMKTLLYANHNKLSFLLGSHIYTELGGIRAFANLLSSKLPNIEFINLHEEHIE